MPAGQRALRRRPHFCWGRGGVAPATARPDSALIGSQHGTDAVLRCQRWQHLHQHVLRRGRTAPIAGKRTAKLLDGQALTEGLQATAP